MKLSKAIIISLIAHIVLVGLLAFNYQFSKIEVKQSKTIRQMKARTVSTKNINKLKQKDIDKKNKEIERLREIKRKKKRAEQKIEDQKRKEKQKKEKRKREEKKAAEVKKKRVADEKKRRLKLAKDKKKAEAEKKKKKKAEDEKKRKKKLAEEKKRKEKERKKKLAEEKAAQKALELELEAQMADEAAALNEIKQQQVLSEVDKYNLLIRGKIKRNWIEPESKGSCIFRINLAPGGLIIGIEALSGDKQHCESGRRAINKSEPLPVSNDPDVFAVLKVRTFELENKSKKGEYDN